jgi:5-methylcytosine-specific restriction enzyme subunit McrC
VSHTLQARDLSPLGDDLTAEDHEWLDQIQQHVRASEHLIRLGEAAAAEDGEDYIVSRDALGRWWTGRYIGDLALGDRRLEIRPRLGEVVVEEWLGEALNLVAVPETAARQQSESFIARLMGAVWCRAVDQASRHGPPSFRREHQHEGFYVRGRLDLRRSARLRGAGSPHVASRQSYRDLDNDVSRTLVAAERVLTARIGHDHWRTPRVDEMLPWLRSAVGSRPRLPARRQLGRMRYTPITRQFKAVADLSWRLAQLQGYSAASEEGKSEGLLVDVAELWELFVIKCIERALPGHRVVHGTHAAETNWLLTSLTRQGAGLGRLKPDVLVYDRNEPVVVADAKYKRLQNRWPERPQGVDRADLYQLTSYLARYSPQGQAQGLLLYPRDPAQQDVSDAEARGPWQTEAKSPVRLTRLAVHPQEAVEELQELLAL